MRAVALQGPRYARAPQGDGARFAVSLLHRNSISKTRLDALADAMFGVAMTLLVIDIRLPESFDPKTGAELWHAITELQSKFLVYLITFFVVGMRGLGNSRLAAGQETVTEQFARWTLLHLFLITADAYRRFAPQSGIMIRA